MSHMDLPEEKSDTLSLSIKFGGKLLSFGSDFPAKENIFFPFSPNHYLKGALLLLLFSVVNKFGQSDNTVAEKKQHGDDYSVQLYHILKFKFNGTNSNQVFLIIPFRIEVTGWVDWGMDGLLVVMLQGLFRKCKAASKSCFYKIYESVTPT